MTGTCVGSILDAGETPNGICPVPEFDSLLVDLLRAT